MKRGLAIMVLAVASTGVGGCSRLVEEEVPPEEQPYRRSTRADAYGYDGAGARVRIDGPGGATLRVFMCASDVDMEEYDVEDAIVNLFVDVCEQRAQELGLSVAHPEDSTTKALPNCDDRAVELREHDWVINHPERCAESSFPLE